MQAAHVLCQILQKGTITLTSGKKIPVAGDTTRLYHADGLTPLQKRMALNMHFLAKNQPGGQQLRQRMGHAQFGARVVFGDCLFYTLSPNEQHSSLVLRLSRYRSKDPCIQTADQLHEHVRSCAGRLNPSLVQEETATVELPAYKFRRVMCARDPMAVMEAFMLQIKLKLPRLFGMRACPMCPRCNNRGCKFP